MVACTKSEFQKPKAEETGMVELTLTVNTPVNLMATKGDMADVPTDIDNIRIAMFGTSGYPQAYTLAEPVGKYADKNGTNFQYKVLLPVYEGEAHIHIIANAPADMVFDGNDEYSAMLKMEKTGGEGSYWARIILPEGIMPMRGSNGTMVTNETTGNFVPSDETAEFFAGGYDENEKPVGITLVRNFAEIVLDMQATNLEDPTWTLIHTPQTGSVVPAVSETETVTGDDGEDKEVTTIDFLADFKDYVYDPESGKMKNTDGTAFYEGYMTSNKLNSTIPGGDDITTGADAPLFMYERLKPIGKDSQPTAILLKGYYVNEAGDRDANPSYYRIDLMNEDLKGYFTIYRNFKYVVEINQIGNRGDSSPELAATHNSGGNVSMSVETQTLTDISDGTGRLFVEFVDKTYATGSKASTDKTIWVRYVPNVKDLNEDGSFKYDNSKITISDLSKREVNVGQTAPDHAIIDESAESFTYTDENIVIDGKTYPTRTYTFHVGPQGAAIKESHFTVSASNGKTGAAKSTLYRDITVRTMQVINTTISFSPSELNKEQPDTPTVMTIELSDTLQQAMFPVLFKIEDSEHVLNPTGTDGTHLTDPAEQKKHVIAVPVKVDKSIIPGHEDENSFYFIRTVNWSEYEPQIRAYRAAIEAGTQPAPIQFKTEFKLIGSVEAHSTDVYVANDEYFSTDSETLAITGRYRKTGSFKFTPSMFGSNDFTETSTDGMVTLTFSNVYYSSNSYIQLVNSNTTATATFKANNGAKVTKVSMDFYSSDNSRGNITAEPGSVSGRSANSPYTRSWSGTYTENLVLTYSPYRSGGMFSTTYPHQMTSIIVQYEWYE